MEYTVRIYTELLKSWLQRKIYQRHTFSSVYGCGDVTIIIFYQLTSCHSSWMHTYTRVNIIKLWTFPENIWITFVQRRPNVFDARPPLYKCYTNVLYLLGEILTIYRFTVGHTNIGSLLLVERVTLFSWMLIWRALSLSVLICLYIYII